MGHVAGLGGRSGPYLMCLIGALALGLPLTLAAPWFHTGQQSRSAYAFLRALDGAGVLAGWQAELLRAGVFAMPVLSALSLATVVLRAPGLAAVFCGLGACVLLMLSVGILVHDQGSAPAGPWLGTVLGGAAMAISFLYCRDFRYLSKRSGK